MHAGSRQPFAPEMAGSRREGFSQTERAAFPRRYVTSCMQLAVEMGRLEFQWRSFSRPLKSQLPRGPSSDYWSGGVES